jgi:hypothetical protein
MCCRRLRVQHKYCWHVTESKGSFRGQMLHQIPMCLRKISCLRRLLSELWPMRRRCCKAWRWTKGSMDAFLCVNTRRICFQLRVVGARYLLGVALCFTTHLPFANCLSSASAASCGMQRACCRNLLCRSILGKPPLHKHQFIPSCDGASHLACCFIYVHRPVREEQQCPQDRGWCLRHMLYECHACGS